MAQHCISLCTILLTLFASNTLQMSRCLYFLSRFTSTFNNGAHNASNLWSVGSVIVTYSSSKAVLLSCNWVSLSSSVNPCNLAKLGVFRFITLRNTAGSLLWLSCSCDPVIKTFSLYESGATVVLSNTFCNISEIILVRLFSRYPVILSQINTVSPGTDLLKSHEPQSRTNESPFKKQWVLNWKCLGLYVTRQLIWRQTPQLCITAEYFTEIKIYSFYFNPLSLNVHIQILQSDLYIFL